MSAVLSDSPLARRDRSALIVAVTLGVLVFLAVALMVLVLSRGGSGEAVQVPVFTVPEGDLSIVSAARTRVSATSTHEADGVITYAAENTIDGDLTTAWNSDAAPDQGRGQTLTYRFSEPIDLQAIRFVNGYARSADVFEANHRIKELVVITDGLRQAISLTDADVEQEVAFDFGLTSKVIIEVSDVYPGTGFADPALSTDLALTEVVFVALQR